LHRTTPRTDFGEEVARFSFDHNIPLVEIARRCGVSYETMRSAMYGRTPGTTLIEKVKSFMSNFNPSD